MTSDRRDKGSHRIPIRFTDADDEVDPAESALSNMERSDPDNEGDEFLSEADVADDDFVGEGEPGSEEELAGGPATAELIATRSELKRVEAENAELKDRLARRQADFENYRKRVDRERGETYNRVVADIAAKLLPVVDNLKRALEAEASVESSESDEFRHFLSGVDLIYKQINGVLDALGVKPIAAVGEQFNPHVHEAVVTEATDDYEPDTVIQEIVAGYRLGDKLIRPALVKVATRK
ncbi:MAG TPA: nucleotide exchange factor GrpE [Pyrinomonadaceae bacterium]|jgi:molecular chaperone GrpE|nr:nucleotide exchange factor GrpE [Pyrinomonadaceae bacterium]